MAVAISSEIKEVFSRLGLSVKSEQEEIISGILKGELPLLWTLPFSNHC